MATPQLSRRSSCASVDSCSQPRCRLCWGDEDFEGNRLISPCSCKGSMQYIHFGCLQHWLEVTRQQGRPRRSIRCEVCKSKYNTNLHGILAGEEQQLMPSLWHDPFTLASLLHGGYRAYVAISGLLRAYAIYRSIQYGNTCLPVGGLATPPAAGAGNSSGRRVPFYNSGRFSSAGSSSAAVGWQQQQQQLSPPFLQDQQALGHHLSVTLPLGGGRQHVAANREVLAAIRERFDSATMVQVYWYTSLMALTPQPPNADAFAGMALGATIGGMMAQLVFLPMLGSGKLAALSHSCRLLLRCLIRLVAAEACQRRGYRLLAAAVRAAMQRNTPWWLRLPWMRRLLRQRRRQQQQEQEQQQEQPARLGE